MKKIIVQIAGGVGNQLFQYATAFALAKRWGLSLKLDIRCPSRASGHFLQYRLDHFNISSKPASRLIWKILTLRKKGIVRLTQNLRKIAGICILKEENVCRIDPRLFDFAPRGRMLYLDGYWQTPGYFEDCREDILRECAFRAAPCGHNLEMLRQINETPEAVSLHIRRGDYLTIQGSPVLPTGYYDQAVRMMREKLASPTFFVFSDDIGWAKSNLTSGGNFVFVDINGVDSAHEDLRLFAACGHHIIANSSFSWWGAWLNPAEDKIVIAPKYWMMKEDTYYPDLFPKSWILLDNLKITPLNSKD